jgi:TonB family protein
MKLLFISTMLFVASFSYAQRKILNVSFLKNDGRYVTDRDSADYFRIISEPDSGSISYNVGEYYKDGKRKLLGKSLSVDPLVLEGTCVTFYHSGNRQNTANYKKGLRVGEEFEFYPNGKLYLVKEYPDNKDRYNDITYNYLVKTNYDSLGVAIVENGNGYYQGYDDKFSVIEEVGSIKDGKRDGMWKGNIKKEILSFIETYMNGELINGSATFDDGTSTSYNKTRGVPPKFKGGLEAFGRFLTYNIRYPADAREHNIQGRVIISFIVEKNGKVGSVVATRPVCPSIDAEAVRIVKMSPNWVPCEEFGRAVRVAYSVPVSFTLSRDN